MATPTRARNVSVAFETPETPPLAQAVSLALAIIRTLKVPNWVDAQGRLDEFDLTEPQLELLNKHSALLVVVNPAPPVLTLAVCPTCDGWTATSGTAPTRCKTKLGCLGKPIKAAAAKKLTPAKPDQADEPAEPNAVPEQLELEILAPAPEHTAPKLTEPEPITPAPAEPIPTAPTPVPPVTGPASGLGMSDADFL